MVNVESADGKDRTEFAADDVVIWNHGPSTGNVQNGFVTDPDGKNQT